MIPQRRLLASVADGLARDAAVVLRNKSAETRAGAVLGAQQDALAAVVLRDGSAETPGEASPPR
ncbi:hypothetical protein [Streptomyces sp. TE3672]